MQEITMPCSYTQRHFIESVLFDDDIETSILATQETVARRSFRISVWWRRIEILEIEPTDSISDGIMKVQVSVSIDEKRAKQLLVFFPYD